MTSDERQYLIASKAIMGPAVVSALAIVDITQRTDFSTDVSAWYEMDAELQAFHSYWQQIQTLTPPTRLAAYHQACLDYLYNMDQTATYFDQGLNNLDPSLIETSVTYLDAATSALTRVNDETTNYETISGADISEDLP